MSTTHYYYLDALHVTRGPVGREELAKMIAKEDVLVWGQGLPDWTKASSLPEFRHIKPAHAVAALEEMLQLCGRVMADGQVETHEAHRLQEWVKSHREATNHWPGNVLAQRLTDIFRDGKATDNEREELRELLQQILTKPDPSASPAHADIVPYDQPPPEIVFGNRNFCLAGRFVFGTIERCVTVLQRRGAICHADPQWDTHFTVVGALQPDTGKIQRAVKLKKLGSGCKIVSEQHWAAFAPLGH